MADLAGIVERLQERLGPISGSPVPLEGGITNRNFKMSFSGRQYVIRLPGKDTNLLGIDREAERAANERAATLGIAPAVVAADPDCLVTEFMVCRPVDPGQLRADPSGVARALRAFHDSGLELPTRFWVPDLLDAYAEIVRDRGGTLPESYGGAAQIANRIAAVLPLQSPAPCHGDLLPANILIVDAGKTMLVDWEYAGMGHRLFDLGNLAVNNDFGEEAEERLLDAYHGGSPTQSQRAALKLMKVMSDAREAAWGVVQGAISALDFDFDAYARKHFERLELAVRDPRLEDWLDAASA